MNIANQSFDVSTYLSEGWARRQRLLNPPNAFKAPSTVPALTVVHRAHERPLWRTQAISFDAHVLAYQWNLAKIKANRAQEYIKERCVELGADYAKVTDKRCKQRDITGPRQLIMFELKTLFQLSYPRIGRELGGLDHSTVLWGVTRIAKIRGEQRPEFVTGADRLLSDPALKQEVMADYDRGMSADGLSEKFAVSVSAIATVAKLENWRRPNNPLLHNVSYKTASVDLPALQSDIESGVTYREMTLRHRISEKTIRRIKRNHGWKRAGIE
jgi:Mor family transcriptional regulator